MGGHNQETDEGILDTTILTLEGLMTRGTLKMIQEEVHQKLAILQGQEEAHLGLALYHFSSFHEGIIRHKDIQNDDSMVEALSKDKEERPKVASMHASEGSYRGENLSESSRSSRSSLGERRERHGRVERIKRSQWRKSLTCLSEKFLHFGGITSRKPMWIGSSSLSPIEFGDNALVWWTQVMEDIRRVDKNPCES
ncbi:hypothetical protein CR513_01943, partial [Mucuna pruriens]